ncbi:MAG: EAL domain-containing protein [Desulfuromonadales bacterium]
MFTETYGNIFSFVKKLSPVRIALYYSFFGIVWIVLTDTATARFALNLEQFGQIASFKGILFIIATGGFLHLMIRHYARQLHSSEETFHLAEQELNKLAYYDRETGLPNLNLLLDRLRQVISFNSRKKKCTSVIYISLTGFKAVVDAFGHSGGSEVLRGIAERLVSAVRQYDTIARIHRDEFVLVLGGTVLEGDVGAILIKLQKVFSEPLRLGKVETLVPACFGVACFPMDGVTSELLLQNAHIAMNQARQNGETFKYFSEALNKIAVERHSIETGLLRAMDEGEFFLCYQPKMDINGKDIIGMEALVRWQRPGQGIIPPDKFIPVAEENGLIVRLGTWVLHEACRQNRAWQDTGLPKLKVSVNLSARQLRDAAFVSLVMQILAETGLDPHYLELELTESALMGDTDDTVCKLLRLKELGISVSVDDFGTGYSSLSYLKHLPIDTIKIDRSFVRDIVNDPDDAAIVDAIVAMAHSLKLNVIAEGVETLEQLEFLQQRKCHQVQGYFFSKPLAPHHFEYFLRTGKSVVATTGNLSFQFTPDFSAFEGTWNYQDMIDWNCIWNGVLLEGSGQDGAVRSYRTNYGTVRLTFEGEIASGDHTYNGGRIEGIIQGNLLIGIWRQCSRKDYVKPITTAKETSLLLWSKPVSAPELVELTNQPAAPLTSIEHQPEFIVDITIKAEPVLPGDTIPVVLNRFQNDTNLLVLPVVEHGRVIGVINRSTFIEEHIVGRHGFGYHINHSTKISELMVPVELCVESTASIEDAARQIQASGSILTRMDNICVITDGDYLGIVNVNKLFNAITEINLTLAKGANPLTGLPGNESIQREIASRLAARTPFAIGYIDIDNFKPYNDYYGFQKGDDVIKTLGDIVNKVVGKSGSSSFCGHIGGDDFIIISEPHQAETISLQIIKTLEDHLQEFHGERDYSAGSYSALNRKGFQETFGLLSISIGIVNTLITPVTSYAQLASIATEVKKSAKKRPGSSIVINHRKIGDTHINNTIMLVESENRQVSDLHGLPWLVETR